MRAEEQCGRQLPPLRPVSLPPAAPLPAAVRAEPAADDSARS
jgi:hypothetical protein